MTRLVFCTFNRNHIDTYFSIQIVYWFKNWKGKTEKCTFDIFHSLLNMRELILPTKVVELFFSLLKLTVRNCWALSPTFSMQNIFFPSDGSRYSISTAASVVQLLHDNQKMELCSADIIFFPFLDETSGEWNLITFQKSNKMESKTSKNMHCLYFFNGGTKAGDAKERRISVFERNLLR